MLRRTIFAPRPAILAGVVTAGLLALTPSLAHAGANPGAGVTFPTTVTVGQTGLPASVILENRNTAPNTGDTNSVCNVGEASPPCLSPENGITLIPTCKLLAGGLCPAGGADPNVFRVSSTGTGRLGTACAGTVFDIVEYEAVFGAVRLTPRPAGSHVTLSGFGASCAIDFTFDVLKSPTGDQDPSTPGTQTAQSTSHTQWVGAFGPGALSNNATASSNGTTVLRAGPPTIATVASPDVAVGGALTDQATVTGLVNPVAGAVVTFRLYSPSDTTCADTPVFTSVQPVVLAGTTATATSAAYTPTAPGVYRWIATYGGDANNLPVSGTCGIASETRTVTVPCTPPPGPAPAGGTLCSVTPPPPPPNSPVDCTPPPGPAPAGEILCARGAAAIRGRTGCQGSPFAVQVSGRQIERVVFTLDGKVVRTLNKPNSGARYSLMVNPRRMRTGVHRVLARTTFTSRSGTKARVLRVTFSRCARRAAAPKFTG